MSSAFTAIRTEANRWRVRETGGILVGYWSDNKIAVITHATGPGPDAHHGLSTFEPDSRFSQQQLNSIYMGSEGRLSYVGDWHTHPLGSLVPSDSDSETTFGVADDPTYRAPRPILMLFRLKRFRSQSQARALIYLATDRIYCDAMLKVIE